MKIICTQKQKEQLIKESEYLHNLNIDSDKANTLMHLYQLPEKYWIIIDGEE